MGEWFAGIRGKSLARAFHGPPTRPILGPVNASSQRPGSAPRVAGGSHLAAHVVREGLQAVATPTVVGRILHRALHMAQEHEVPEGGERLLRFVDRHLRAATAFVVDDATAEALLEQLKPVLARMPSEPSQVVSRAARELDRTGAEVPGHLPVPDLEPGIAMIPGPEVLLASMDPERCDALRDALGAGSPAIALRPIEDVVALLDALEACPPDAAPVVVIDCADPSVQPTTLATIASELPADALVVLWGCDDVQAEQAMQLVDAPEQWTRRPGEPPDALGAFLGAHLAER